MLLLVLGSLACADLERVTAVPTGDVSAIHAGAEVVPHEVTADLSSPGPKPVDATKQSGARAPELPRVYLDYAYPAVTGRSIMVGKGGDLQSALDKARRGDEVVIAAGATFTGNFVLPAKPGSAADGWIVVRGEQAARLPGIGTRVSASDGILMPTIVTPNTGPALKTEAGASGWWLSGLEVTVSGSVQQQQFGLIFLGESRRLQTTMASVPQDIVLDRMYIHGQTTTNMSRCVALNSGRTQISDSYIVECHGKGFDSQAIGGWNGPGPYKIVNNALHGAGENIMFGGGDPGIPGLVPSDIEIRRNHFFTPLAWKGVWTKKNLFELKNAVRVLVEGNVFDGSWSDGQTGWAVVLKSANQSGDCAWCRTTDVTFRRNLIRNAGAGINIAARGDNPNVDSTARRIRITETVLEHIGVGAFGGDKRGFQLLRGTSDIVVDDNVLSGDLQAAVMLDRSPGSARARFAGNVFAYGQYGAIATGAGPGSASLAVGAPGGSWTRNVFVGPQRSGFPVGTSFVSQESHAANAQRIRSLVQAATAGVADQ